MVAPPPSKLDQRQILQGVYDEENGRLRTSAEATIVNADIDVALDSTEDNVAIRSSTGIELDIETDGSINTRIKDEAGQAFTDTNYLPIGQSNHDILNLNANVQVNNTDVSSTNLLPSYQPSVVSTLNSSSTPLGISGTFIGTSEEVKDYASISIIVHTDRDSAMDGLSIEYSVNGTVWNDSDKYTVFADQARYVTVAPEARYFRVVYTNGVSAQTFFYLQVIYHRNYIKPSSHRIKDSINEENDAELSKSVLTGKNPDGVFVNESSSGVVSVASTSTPLGIGGSFQSPYFDTVGFASVMYHLKMDQAGTITIETSDNGVDVVRTTTYPIQANSDFFISQTAVARYIRIRVSNTSGIAQTYIGLQTIMKITPFSSTALTISSPLTSNAIAVNSRSILAGQQENGTFNNVGLSNSASVKVAITDRPSEVRNRVKVEARIFNQTLTTTPTVVHTVTVGKTFYLESMIISAINSANVIGEWRIVDGTTDKIGYLLTEKTTGSSAGTASSSPALPEPIPFTTSFSVREVLGDITLSVYIIGYEE